MSVLSTGTLSGEFTIDLVNAGIIAKSTALESLDITFTENNSPTWEYMQDWYNEARENGFTIADLLHMTDAKKLYYALKDNLIIDGKSVDPIEFFKIRDHVFFEKYRSIIDRPRVVPVVDVNIHTTPLGPTTRKAFNCTWTKEALEDLKVLCSIDFEGELLAIREHEYEDRKR